MGEYVCSKGILIKWINTIPLIILDENKNMTKH